MRTAGDERFDAGDMKHAVAHDGRGAWPLARIGEREGGGHLAAKHRHQEALALRRRAVAQHAAVTTEYEPSENAAGGGDRLAQRRLAKDAEAATTDVAGLRQPEQTQLLRPGADASAKLRRSAGLVRDPLGALERQEFVGQKGADAVAQRGQVGRQQVHGHGRLPLWYSAWSQGMSTPVLMLPRRRTPVCCHGGPAPSPGTITVLMPSGSGDRTCSKSASGNRRVISRASSPRQRCSIALRLSTALAK